MQLSILTCHLPERKDTLLRLAKRLVPQCVDYGDLLSWPDLMKVFLEKQGLQFSNGVEWLIDDRERPVTTGAKRNRLLERAKGDHAMAVDDDDLITPDAIKRIMFALKSDPDAVGIEGVLKRPSHPDKKFIHSITIGSWYETDQAYMRSVNHLNPIRRSIALLAGFPDAVHGEDRAFSENVKPFLKTEVMLTGTLYEYYCR